MRLLEKYNLKPLDVLKICGLGLVIIIVVVFSLRMIGASFSSVFNKGGSAGFLAGVRDADYSGNYYAEEAALDAESMDFAAVKGGVALSQRNIAAERIMPPQNGGIAGDTAEEFEVTDYSATVETRNLGAACRTIADLKAREYVIFENANQYDRGCNYQFKVRRENVNEILEIIKSLKPKELNENVYTIKQLVDDYTGEIEILEKKLKSIDETLEKAVAAYDDIAALAVKTEDAESLAKIIDSKINIIERLAEERININSQLERISRSKAEQLDRLEYTFFYVNVYENKFVDGKNIKDSWKAAIKEFARDINKVAQDMTINLVKLLFLAFQYLVYLFILLVIAKYGWKAGKYFWKK
ncbi:MAG: hypothetical protein WCW25_05335 [Patescibacteria group bacterium]|jgi:hypothetical protein